MNGLPLHPTVVHFPIVLSVLLPIFAAGAWWAIRRGAAPRRAWLIPVALGAALAVSAFVALRTGAAEEERVESVVSEGALHEHEEAAERFLVLSAAVLAVLALGVLGGAPGKVARGLGVAGAVALVLAGVQVGHAGGELVYVQGAASAYTGTGAMAETAVAAEADHGEDD